MWRLGAALGIAAAPVAMPRCLEKCEVPSRATAIQPEELYSPSVLVGGWFEERQRYHIEPLRHITTNLAEYPEHATYKVPLPFCRRPSTFRQHFLHHGDEYRANFTTTCDLVHNHFFSKNLRSPPAPRHYSSSCLTYLPQVDYLPSFGNLTNYGYREWLVDREAALVKDILTVKTIYQMDYTVPVHEEPPERRKVPCVYQSVSTYPPNNCHDLRLRGRQMMVMPDPKPWYPPKPRWYY